MKIFTLTDDHLKLARRMCVGWQDCEYGAPEIDPKRPYGNSNVVLDIAEILGWKLENDELNEYQSDRAAQYHIEMQTALQIILSTGQFKSGVYECDEYSNDWQECKRK